MMFAGLMFAMDDAFAVRGVKRVSNLRTRSNSSSISSGLSKSWCFRVYAIEKLHGDESAAVFFADVVNRADVGMVQR